MERPTPPIRRRLHGAYGIRLLRDRRVLIAGAAVFLLSALVIRLAEFLIFREGEPWGFDFSSYWYAGKAVLEGRSMYWDLQLEGPYVPQGRHLYTYPPFLAVVAAPLAAAFPTFRDAQSLWAALELAVLLVAIAAIVISHRAGSWRAFAILTAAALAFPPVVSELLNGNVHLLLLGLFALGWLGLHRGSVVGELLAGAAIGAATLVKIFPAVVLVWFLLTGHRRAAVSAVLTVLVLAVGTVPIVGIEPWLNYPTVLLNLGRSTDTTDTLAPTAWLSEIVDFTLARTAVSVAGLSVLAWAAFRLRAPVSYALAVWVSVLIAPGVYHHYLALAVLPLAFGWFNNVSRPLLLVSYLAMFGGEQPLLGGFEWLTNRALPSIGALTLLAALLFTRPAAVEPKSSRSSSWEGSERRREPSRPVGLVGRAATGDPER